MTYTFTENYFKEVETYADALMKRKGETVEERRQNVDTLVEAYTSHVIATTSRTDVTPPSSVLYRLGTYIMREDFEDKRKNKSQVVEYNVLSERQERRRAEKEFPTEDIWYDEYGKTDGRKTVTARNEENGNMETKSVPIYPDTVPNTTKPYLW